jgi:hypothetical protein
LFCLICRVTRKTARLSMMMIVMRRRGKVSSPGGIPTTLAPSLKNQVTPMTRSAVRRDINMKRAIMAREPRKPPKRKRLKNTTNQRKSKTILSIKKRNQAALTSWENQHTHFLHPNQNQVNQLSSQIRPPRMILFSKVSDLRLS